MLFYVILYVSTYSPGTDSTDKNQQNGEEDKTLHSNNSNANANVNANANFKTRKQSVQSARELLAKIKDLRARQNAQKVSAPPILEENEEENDDEWGDQYERDEYEEDEDDYWKDQNDLYSDDSEDNDNFENEFAQLRAFRQNRNAFYLNDPPAERDSESDVNDKSGQDDQLEIFQHNTFAEKEEEEEEDEEEHDKDKLFETYLQFQSMARQSILTTADVDDAVTNPASIAASASATASLSAQTRWTTVKLSMFKNEENSDDFDDDYDDDDNEEEEERFEEEETCRQYNRFGTQGVSNYSASGRGRSRGSGSGSGSGSGCNGTVRSASIDSADTRTAVITTHIAGEASSHATRVARGAFLLQSLKLRHEKLRAESMSSISPSQDSLGEGLSRSKAETWTSFDSSFSSQRRERNLSVNEPKRRSVSFVDQDPN